MNYAIRYRDFGGVPVWAGKEGLPVTNLAFAVTFQSLGGAELWLASLRATRKLPKAKPLAELAYARVDYVGVQT